MLEGAVRKMMGASNSVSCCAHLIDVAEMVGLGLGNLESHLELILENLEMSTVAVGRP